MRPRFIPVATPATQHRHRQSIVQRIVNDSGRLGPNSVIDPRLDVGAQQAILRMARGTPRQRVDAVGLHAAVKAGRLQGIFGDDLRAAAQLAARLGTVRWELIPRGQDAALIDQLELGQPPTIIFREQVRSVPARLDPALSRAFSGLRHRVGSESIQRVAAGPAANPFFCAFLCALCAAAILDGPPGDEIVICALCVNSCVRGSG